DFPTPVCTFDGRVKVGAGFADMLQHADACALMESAPDDRALEVAIRIALCRPDKGGRALTWSESGRFRIGRKFRKSCQGVCRTQPKAVNEAILRAIVEAVRKEKTNDTHELRNTDEGGSGTRMRGKDKAVRRDVDDDLHLHYWDCDDGLIELGSVVHHNDFSIPY
ncbi:MAG: hypothetical protein Q4F72_08980, partial [Desulfovibrionaceae bacterium]|nr:hypothetical protein [Desulfovibrionaceae bacterium]